MRIKELTRIVDDVVLAGVVTAVLCTGWTTTPSYAGSDIPQHRSAVVWYSEPDLPEAQVAVLNLGGDLSQVLTKDAVQAVGVDGTIVRHSNRFLHGYGPPDSIKLLPGRHTIGFTPNGIGV